MYVYSTLPAAEIISTKEEDLCKSNSYRLLDLHNPSYFKQQLAAAAAAANSTGPTTGRHLDNNFEMKK
jgi:hypothetical protein